METNLDTENADGISNYSYRATELATEFLPARQDPEPVSHEQEVAARVFDGIDYPYLIIDEENKLIWANRAARQVIARSPDFEIGANRNLCAAGVTQSQWQRVFRDLDNNERTALMIGGSPAIVSELAPPKASFMKKRQYLIALSKIKSCNDRTLIVVATQLGLTPSECKILIKLTAGTPPLKIAEERQVSESTVRAQVKAILAKFGCHSISNLLLETAKLPLDLP